MFITVLNRNLEFENFYNDNDVVIIDRVYWAVSWVWKIRWTDLSDIAKILSLWKILFYVKFCYITWNYEKNCLFCK